jgi:carboxylesterase
MRRTCARVFLIGHSLGGALALHTAAHEEVAGVVSMCAPLYMQAWMKPLIRATKYVVPLVPTWREDVRDRQARRHYAREVYRWTPLRPVESLMNYLPTLREELPYVTAPALIMVARRDHVVPARDGREIYQRIGSREKYFVTFHHSYHVIMKDHDREEVFAKTEAFILRHAQNIRRDPF